MTNQQNELVPLRPQKKDPIEFVIGAGMGGDEQRCSWLADGNLKRKRRLDWWTNEVYYYYLFTFISNDDIRS